ncbi:small EDRK-rich factor 2-like isoform X1 [Phyllopteryx taeniolatus]|uniref:small EDRK-rich factor 2-like isoform X1 n=1 Tax=Phyllopteryx taeniolatus TaxID=161469 RepID=UPI002AD451A1|nr:small EDRK-rich factor 2-like isoform X1 [Phyllopteryx taeniolatus]
MTSGYRHIYIYRGNQRELARQKAAKKATETGKGKRNEDGLSAAARKQRDAEIMQQKQKKADGGEKDNPKSK